MQPTFRRSNSGVPQKLYSAPNEDHAWVSLKKGGANGLVSVLTLLSWWGRSLRTASQWQRDSSNDWDEIVQDVTESFKAMKGIVAVGPKRKGAPSGKENVTKKYVALLTIPFLLC